MFFCNQLNGVYLLKFSELINEDVIAQGQIIGEIKNVYVDPETYTTLYGFKLVQPFTLKFSFLE